jgi:hypothetical protein
MARTRAYSDLILDARKMADVQNALTRFPDTEVGEYINQGVAEFVDLVIRNRGSRYYESNYVIVTDGQSVVYPLPFDFYQMTTVQVNLSHSAGTQGDVNIQLEEYTMRERAMLSSQTAGWCGQPFGFMLHGGSTAQAMTTQGTAPVTNYGIEFLPRAATNLYVTCLYIPSTPRLVNSYDTFDGINGWEMYPAIWAAIRIRRKDDLDTAELKTDLAEMKERIEALVPHRTRVGPSRITDVRSDWSRVGWRTRSTRWGF